MPRRANRGPIQTATRTYRPANAHKPQAEQTEMDKFDHRNSHTHCGGGRVAGMKWGALYLRKRQSWGAGPSKARFCIQHGPRNFQGMWM